MLKPLYQSSSGFEDLSPKFSIKTHVILQKHHFNLYPHTFMSCSRFSFFCLRETYLYFLNNSLGYPTACYRSTMWVGQMIFKGPFQRNPFYDPMNFHLHFEPRSWAGAVLAITSCTRKYWYCWRVFFLTAVPVLMALTYWLSWVPESVCGGHRTRKR